MERPEESKNYTCVDKLFSPVLLHAFLMMQCLFVLIFNISPTGYYMYMEMSGKRRNDKARLVSIKFHALKGGACQMRMFYHMFGRHSKDFTVYIQREGSASYTTLFTATGNLGDKWNKAVIDLSKEYTPFRIVIEGIYHIISYCYLQLVKYIVTKN